MHNEQNAVLDCSETTVKYPTFAERLRPRLIDELLISNSSIAKFNAMITSRDVMNMIFYGMPGTGKTETVKDLAKAVKAHKIAPLFGFGEKTEKNIVQGLEFLKQSKGRFLLGEIMPAVKLIEERLRKRKEIKEKR